jgi:serine/threonine protein kinase
MKRYRLSYLNIANKEKKDNNSKEEVCQDLKNIDDYIKEEDEKQTEEHKSIQNNINDINENEITINSNENLNLVKDKFKYDLMRNVIVSQETISQIAKDSIIPIFNDKDYRYIRPIGEGAYGLIYLVENVHNRKQFALKKILCKDLYEIMKHKNQFELIYSMNHKNIMEIYNLQYKYLDKTTYAIYVLMERGLKDWSIDIRKRIINKKPYKEEEIVNILKQIVSGLVYLQKRNIAHRDIKPQNILLFNGNIYKIADLGEAKNLNNNDGHMTLRVSELYMSPSLYERHKSNKKDTFHNAFKSDVFSLGFSCLYAMGLNLKIIENIRELKNMKIIISSIQKDMPKKLYSDKLLKIIFKMIEVDENKRCDFIELEKELNLIF